MAPSDFHPKKPNGSESCDPYEGGSRRRPRPTPEAEELSRRIPWSGKAAERSVRFLRTSSTLLDLYPRPAANPSFRKGKTTENPESE